MVITWITENYYPNKGGMAQSCDRIVNGLRKSGKIVHLLHFSHHHSRIGVQKQFNGTYIAIPTNENYPHALQIGFQCLEKELKDSQFLVAFGGFLPILCVPIYASWLHVPYSVCISGNDFDVAIFHYQRRAVLLEALKNANSIIVNTTDKLFKINQLIKNANVQFIANGIEEDWKASHFEMGFAEEYKKQVSPKKIIGLFGQLKEKKGILFFLESVRYAQLVHAFHFIIAGELEESVHDFLEHNHFHYEKLAFIERYQLIKYYLACDWIAIPSFYDGMPNVLLESMALGIPVIASNVDGMKDVIEHEKTGLLFQNHDSSDLMYNLQRILDYSDNQYAIIQNNAQKVVKEKFSLSLEIQNFIRILQIT
jgi:glycosyltransferase involved in cell wall biosynthesis